MTRHICAHVLLMHLFVFNILIVMSFPSCGYVIRGRNCFPFGSPGFLLICLVGFWVVFFVEYVLFIFSFICCAFFVFDLVVFVLGLVLNVICVPVLSILDRFSVSGRLVII